MRKIEANIVADSLGPNGNRITTMLVTFPRFILAELNTHRLFSKNSASSRAIPFVKMLESVSDDPFLPIAWQKDHPGMQGTEYFNSDPSREADGGDLSRIEVGWNEARKAAIHNAKWCHDYGLTKQLCNRLLEPFLWHTVLVTATEWDNFFDLRTPKYTIRVDSKQVPYKSRKELRKAVAGWWSEPSEWDKMTEADWFTMSKAAAEIHMQALSEAMYDAMKGSNPKDLKAGEWHVPFGDTLQDKDIMQYVNGDFESRGDVEEAVQDFRNKIATSRCARLSYMTFDKEIDYRKDVELYDRLLSSKHMSPFEHCARAMNDSEYSCFVKGPIFGLKVPRSVPNPNLPGVYLYPESMGWCNNYRGFIQHRYMLDNPGVCSS